MVLDTPEQRVIRLADRAPPLVREVFETKGYREFDEEEGEYEGY